MALDKSFSQLNRFDNFEAPKTSTKEAVPKDTSKKDDAPKKEIKKSPKKDALSRMTINKSKKSVRKSFMFSEKAVENLHKYAEKTGRTDNDFLNELLTNLESYLN